MGRKIAAILFMILVFRGTVILADENTDYRIEQVYINMPEVIAYYRMPGENSGDLEAYLGGKQLEQQEAVSFADSKEAVEYYILLDVSASIRRSRFEDIRNSLGQFLSEMREGDRMVLLTFGDEVHTVLTGAETREEAASTVGQLENADQNTVLFEAIDQASDMIWSAEGDSEMRRVMAVISDGKDCADNTRSTESVESRLVSRGIPLYTIAVENNEGDPETEISEYRSRFGSLSRNTGGLPWVSSEGSSVLDCLNAMRDAVMGSYRARFTAETNEISNTREDFVLKFPGAGNMSDTVSVLVGRAQKDEIPPEIVGASSEESNSITIRYSEAVQNADVLNHYSVRMGGRTVPVQQIIQPASEENTYTLIFGTDLYEGDYEVSVSGVTDFSNEKNPLKQPLVTVKTMWQRSTEAAEEGEPEEEKEDAGHLLIWWLPVLAAAVLCLTVLVLVLLRSFRKRRGVPAVDEKEVPAGQAGARKHVRMKQPAFPSKRIVLWVGNGTGEPEKMDVLVEGSCIVGRSEHCDVYCDDLMMSKQHFALELQDGCLFITDLQSMNGTSVNGIRISGRRQLQPGDEIIAGSLRFRAEWQ